MTAAERAALFAELDDILMDGIGGARGDRLWSTFRRCRAALESAPADTARLDWLEMHGVDIGVRTHLHGSRLVRWHRGDAYGETIREAIDNAALQMRILDDPDDGPEAGPDLAATSADKGIEP